MSFIRIKKSGQVKYAYEVTSYWDKETKTSRQKVKYLGKVDDDGNVNKVEQLLLDYGDGYLLQEFVTKSFMYPLLQMITSEIPEIIPLVFYRLSQQSAMYNAQSWFEGNIISKYYNVNLSSQHISDVLAALGDERLQREFFTNYAKTLNCNEGVIIDATSLPNNSNIGFNAWGYSDSSIDKQVRMLFAVDHKTKLPLFFRYLPGNLLDISTLKSTILELKQLGINFKFALMDAGYMSLENIKLLYNNNIGFLTRLPANRKIYKELITKHQNDLEAKKHAVKYGERGLFVKCVPIEFEGHQAYGYIILDPVRKGKELNKIITTSDNLSDIDIDNCGTMVLLSSTNIDIHDVVAHYYSRQAVEQIFGFCKTDLQILPLRRHKDETVRGYLLLQFITLIIFIQLRESLAGKFTVEQALLATRNIKCKIYGENTIVAEFTKRQKEIYKLCNILVPKI